MATGTGYFRTHLKSRAQRCSGGTLLFSSVGLVLPCQHLRHTLHS